MSADCGRTGSLDGVFISTQRKVDYIIDNKVVIYWGEVLGKHSEIFGALEKKDVTFVSDDENVVKVIEEHGLESGFNPFEYTSNGTIVSEEVDEYYCEIGPILDELFKREDNED